MAYKKKSQKKILNTYQIFKKKLSLLKYHELRGFGSEWYLDSDELDNDLLSLDTDEYRDNYIQDKKIQIRFRVIAGGLQ